MGLSTFAVGLLPTYASIGVAAPIILVTLRMLQGLALGGEYGGAAIYVAEHAPANKRGSYTSWIQSTATLGLLLSLLVILACRQLTGDEFETWGWRLPFLLSIVLLGISTWIRLSMRESPAFLKMKAEGKVSKAPLRESFTQWGNLKVVLTALFSINAGQQHRLAADAVGQPAGDDEERRAKHQGDDQQTVGGAAIDLEHLGKEEQHVELRRVEGHRLAHRP